MSSYTAQIFTSKIIFFVADFNLLATGALNSSTAGSNLQFNIIGALCFVLPELIISLDRLIQLYMCS